MDPYAWRAKAKEDRAKKYKDNGWDTKEEVEEINKKEALEHIDYVKTHCTHCDSTNFIDINLLKSCLHERICFECNVCDYKNPTAEGTKFLDYPKTYYKQLLKTHEIKELEE